MTITGLGTIDGQGLLWYKRTRMPTQPVDHDFHNHHLANSPGQGDYYFQGKPTKEEADKVAQHAAPPKSILLVRCTNVLMEGLTVRNSPGWTINLVFCEQVVLRGLTINNPMESPSTDAMDLESCRNVHIDNCTLGAGDDLVTIKSGADAGRAAGQQAVREHHGDQLHDAARPRRHRALAAKRPAASGISRCRTASSGGPIAASG